MSVSTSELILRVVHIRNWKTNIKVMQSQQTKNRVKGVFPTLSNVGQNKFMNPVFLTKC